mmetsp:Transcript_4333/g.6652  ORF Transcript_4333/g.6652 Transcript_4333/m.6652 type:complete len:96 (+) Transcript_4333:747-1034(+)
MLRFWTSDFLVVPLSKSAMIVARPEVAVVVEEEGRAEAEEAGELLDLVRVVRNLASTSMMPRPFLHSKLSIETPPPIWKPRCFDNEQCPISLCPA